MLRFLSVILLFSFIVPAPRFIAQDSLTCGDAPPPRLEVGELGQVTASDDTPQPVNVRSESSLQGDWVGQMPEGTRFEVLDGPVCQDNIFWWRIQAENGVGGWMAEGLSGEYFVEPDSGELATQVPAPTSEAPVEMGECGPVTRLMPNRHGLKLPGGTIDILTIVGGQGEDNIEGQLPEDEWFAIRDLPPQCVDGVLWYQVTEPVDYNTGWIPESDGSNYLVEPFRFVPPEPVAFEVEVQDPLMTNPVVPLPEVVPAASPTSLSTNFFDWDWTTIFEAQFTSTEIPDPLALELPDSYAGNLPVPPVDLGAVFFVADAGLSADQLNLLAQNGFVVVPGGLGQFDQVFGGWTHEDGKGDFITTDMMLHALYLVYENTLMHLEREVFFGRVSNFVARGLVEAQNLADEHAGTDLEDAAHNAALYYAVPAILLAEGEDNYLLGFEAESGFGDELLRPSEALAQINEDILAEAQSIVDQILAAEGVQNIAFLDEYQEDFSQYIVRGYYAGDPLLEPYFRALMWLGRITFKANSPADTLTALMVLDALYNAPGAYDDWLAVADILTFMVGPIDDLSPIDYRPLVEEYFPDQDYTNEDAFAEFRTAIGELPGPRVNSIPLPIGVTAEEVDQLTRGFRLFGQRFTFDGYVMQQLIYPEVGSAADSRTLPLGLDIASILGSDTAFTLAAEAGATEYDNYIENSTALRDQVNTLDGDDWMQDLYGGWLWALQPLFVRDAAITPPMMQTDAWKRKDIHSALGSWTQLKHATLLYAEQPMGGLGGGGIQPPVQSYSFVEPNPEVFARISLVSGGLWLGLEERDLIQFDLHGASNSMKSTMLTLSTLSARLAETARMELAGEEIPYDEYYYMQEGFDGTYSFIRRNIEMWQSEPPPNVALTADVASNPGSGEALQEAIGLVDYIYVITDHPDGLQLTRGPVYSYYEFIVPIDERMTDQTWREVVASGELPPRPTWIDLYFAD